MTLAVPADELDESGEADDVRLAHAEWALDRAALLTVGLRGPDEREAVADYAAELENIGAALDWSTAQARTEMTTSLARGMYDHVLARGGREVHAWIERAAESVWDDPAGGDVLIIASDESMERGDIPRYRELLEQADALGVKGEGMPVPTADEWSSLLTFEGRVDEAVAATDQVPLPHRDDLWLDAYVLLRRSMARAYSGRTTDALEMADEAVRLAEQSQNPTMLGWSHYVRGEALMGVHPGRAIDTYNEALQYAESVDNTFLKGLLSVALATALGRHGDPAKALAQFRETITWWQEVGAWSFLSTTLRNFGEFLTEQVDRNEEAVLVRCSIERFDASSAAGGIDAERDRHLRRTLTERLGGDRFDELRGQAQQLDRDEIVRLALDTIDEELAARRQPGQFRVIVFTDLEQSTRFMADTGDSDGRRIMREYSERIDAALARHNGEAIKELGDGVLATFTSVADALHCVVEMMVEFDAAVAKGELPLRCRVGVHAGEPIIEKGDVHGTTVNLAARVVDRAEGGEILVTDTIRQIAIGADYTFTPVGETELKGIPQPIGLHRLEWA